MKTPTLATDIVVFNIRKNKLKVLLIKMNKKPFVGKWAVPGGFIGEDELSADAASRILFKTTNVSNLYLEQLKLFDDINRDPKKRVVSMAYIAIIKKDDGDLKVSDQYTDIKWFDIDELPEMAYDHKKIIDYGLERLVGKITYSTISLSILSEEFTLSELQEIFEIILKKNIDKRNFRKKLLKQGVIEETGNKKTENLKKPAILYKAKMRGISFKEMI